MTRTSLATAALFATLAGTGPAMAELSVSAGITSESTAALKIGIDKQFPLERLHPRLDLRLGTGLLLLSSEEEDGNAAWLFTPALRYTFAGEREWFVEGGIGAALFLETRLDDRDLSTAWQFHDRLAVGRSLADGELALSVNHFSNGGIKRPNDGFEVLSLGYRWAF